LIFEHGLFKDGELPFERLPSRAPERRVFPLWGVAIFFLEEAVAGIRKHIDSLSGKCYKIGDM